MDTTFRTCLAGLLALLALAPVCASAQTDGSNPLESDGSFNRGGRTAFQFLKIGLGARQAALGEASVALTTDASAAFWNPAGLTGVEHYAGSLNYTRWLAGTNYSGAAVAGRVAGVGTLALSAAALDYGDIPEAVVGQGSDGRTGNQVSGSDVLLGLSVGRQFTDNLSIGLGAKYVHESLAGYGAGAFTFDVGTHYAVGYRGITLAMAAQNLGGTVRYLADSLSDRREGYDLPLVFRLGVASNIAGPDGFVGLGSESRLVGAVEAIHTNDANERLNAGLEYTFNDILALRGGYRLNVEEGSWSVGAGVMPRIAGGRLAIDYAYVGTSVLEAPHRLSLSFSY